MTFEPRSRGKPCILDGIAPAHAEAVALHRLAEPVSDQDLARPGRPSLHVRRDRVQDQIVERDHPRARPGLERRQGAVLHLLDYGQAPGQELNARHGQAERLALAQPGASRQPHGDLVPCGHLPSERRDGISGRRYDDPLIEPGKRYPRARVSGDQLTFYRALHQRPQHRVHGVNRGGRERPGRQCDDERGAVQPPQRAERPVGEQRHDVIRQVRGVEAGAVRPQVDLSGQPALLGVRPQRDLALARVVRR